MYNIIEELKRDAVHHDFTSSDGDGRPDSKQVVVSLKRRVVMIFESSRYSFLTCSIISARGDAQRAAERFEMRGRYRKLQQSMTGIPMRSAST